MPKKEENYKLLDLIDVKLLQKLQDFFAKAIGVACVILDNKGPVTKPSNYNDLCKLNMKNNIYVKCDCDLHSPKLGETAAKKGEPLIFKCSTGLTNFAVPIMINGKLLGSIVGGQIFTEQPDEKAFKKIAKKYNLNENEYINALRKVKIVPDSNIKSIVDLLVLLSSTISEIAYKNFELLEKTKSENLYKNIIETIRNTVDISEVKQKIVEIVGKALKADSCLIVEYDNRSNKYLPISDEYVSSDEIAGYKGFDVNKDAPVFARALKKGHSLLINNKEIFIKTTGEQEFNIEKETLEKYNINSAYAVPLYYQKEFMGVLSIQYIKKEHYIDQGEIDLMEVIADQIAIAIHQANSYRRIQLQAEREKLIADIVTKSLGTFDITQIKQMVTAIGTMMKADRCFVVEFDLAAKRTKPIEPDAEYLSSPDIKSIVGHGLGEGTEEIINLHLKHKDLFVSDTEEDLDNTTHPGIKANYNIIKINSEEYPVSTEYGRLFGIKSTIDIPFFYMNQLKGLLVIEYMREKIFPSNDEVDFLRILGNQVGMVVNQIQLYQDTKKTAVRENLLRRTFEAMRSSLDINVIKTLIVNEVGKIFNANICFIVLFDYVNDLFYIDKYSEYRSSIKEKSYIGVSQEDPGFSWWVAMFKTAMEINFTNVDDFIVENKLKGTPVEEHLVDYKVKSAYCIVIRYTNILLGYLIINYTKDYVVLEENDIAFLKTVAAQAGTALYQAKLYETTQLQVKRENSLRKIFEAIRESLDSNIIKSTIVNEVGKALNADSCFITNYSSDNDYFYVDEYSEYLSSPEEKSLIGEDEKNPKFKWFVNAFRSNEEICFSSVEKFIVKNKLKGTPEEAFIKEYNIKSSYSIPIYYGNSMLGYITTGYRKDYMVLDENALDFLRSLATQAGVAINQANLYKKMQLQAEREKLITNITTKAINTLDVSKIKQVVTDIGIMMRADRCYFVEADPRELQRGIIQGISVGADGEYLASPDIKSIAEYKFPAEEMSIYVDMHLKARDVLVLDYTYEENPKIHRNYKVIKVSDEKYADVMKKYSDLFDTKTFIAMPFIYMNELKGILAIEYVKEKVFPTDDEVDFLRILGNQIGVALNQIQFYNNAKKTAEKESSLRKIFETMRSSLDSNEIKKTIVNELGKALDADTCSIIAYDSKYDYFYLDESSVYLLNPEDESLAGESEKNPKFKWFIDAFRHNREINYPNIDEFISVNNLKGTLEESFLREKNVKSIYSIPINYANSLLGYLLITYKRDYKILGENDLGFLRVLATQVGTAINQANLFKKMQLQAQRERLIANIFSKSLSTLDISQVKKMVTDIGIMMKADRCFFIEGDLTTKRTKPVDPDAEYLSSPDIGSLVGYDFGSGAEEIIDVQIKYKDVIVADFENLQDEIDSKTKLNYNYIRIKEEEYPALTMYGRIFGIKTAICVTFFYLNQLNGSFLLEYMKERVIPSNDEIDFLRILGNQIGMIVNQIQLYQDTKKTAERENLLRRTFEVMRSSLDINIVRKSIVEEIGKALQADICFMPVYDAENNTFTADEYSEYKSSPDIKSYTELSQDDSKFKFFIDKFKNNKEIYTPNMEEFILEKSLHGTPEEEYIKEYNIKSSYGLAIFYADQLLGYLLLQYINNYKTLAEEDLAFLRTLGAQAGISLYQANLYKLTQIQTQGEQINRKMVEILRSSLNKNTIKHMFVQNIGKFFGANRVFFSEYDDKKHVYLSVDTYSEYLSGHEEKSFVGYDWSQDSAREYIQPLLEKRELLIPCWDEYIKERHKGHDFISRFKNANVKSSYNLPVLYQEKIVGYFCIEFTGNVCKKLPAQDISRIRNVCIQAGIALYQSELYLHAIESAKSKALFIASISNELQMLLENIIEISELLSETEFAHDTKVAEYLKNLNESNKQLIELQENISNIVQIESNNYKLDYENVDSESIIMEVVNYVKSVSDYKHIQINTDTTRLGVKADREKLTQILYNFLSGIIKLIPEKGHITVKSELYENKLSISIRVSGRDLAPDVQNEIFEAFKPIDSGFKLQRRNIRLGLSIAKKLIELHNGYIHVDSTDDKGTDIWFVLPNVIT